VGNVTVATSELILEIEDSIPASSLPITIHSPVSKFAVFGEFADKATVVGQELISLPASATVISMNHFHLKQEID